MSGESEEKNLPPSAHKLKKAREKGQVVTSKETLSSITTLVVLLYLYARRQAIWQDLQSLFTAEPAPGLTLMQDLHERTRLAMDIGIGIVVPVFAMVIALAILGGLAISGGPVFSFHPITPNFDKLNPASGFKKLLGRAAWMRLLMHLVRIIAIGALLTVMLWGHIGALIPTPPCGTSCMGRVTDSIIGPLLVGLTAILIMSGLLDYLVQRADFIRQQRMSITEMKREFKEQDGNPHVKGALREMRREMVDRPTGIGQATLLLRNGTRELVAIRFIRDDTPAPVLVARAKGSPAVNRALRARSDLSAVDDGAAVAALSGTGVGDWVSSDEAVTAIVPYLN